MYFFKILCLCIYQVNYLNLHQLTLKGVNSQTIPVCFCNKYMQISNNIDSQVKQDLICQMRGKRGEQSHSVRNDLGCLSCSSFQVSDASVWFKAT